MAIIYLDNPADKSLIPKISAKVLSQKAGIWLKEISVIPGSMWSLIVSLVFNHGLGCPQVSCPKPGCSQLLKPLEAQHIYSRHHTIGTNSCQSIMDNETR